MSNKFKIRAGETTLSIEENGDVLFNDKKIDVEKELAKSFRDLVLAILKGNATKSCSVCGSLVHIKEVICSKCTQEGDTFVGS